jgi:hypothetical protein
MRRKMREKIGVLKAQYEEAMSALHDHYSEAKETILRKE